MSRPQTYIKLSPKERVEIESFMRAVVSREPPDWQARRRAQAIWYSSQGKSVQELSQRYKCSIRAIWSWFAAYRRSGVKGLLSRPVSKRLTQLQRAKLWQMKFHKSKEQPKQRWTYAHLAQWVKKNWGITVSSRRLNQLLVSYSTAVTPLGVLVPRPRRGLGRTKHGETSLLRRKNPA